MMQFIAQNMAPIMFMGLIVFLLFAITVVNYIDRAALSYGMSKEMTGTLVKCVQRLTAALMGSGPRWAWLPYALLWMGLVAGACSGAAVYGAVGTAGVWLAVAAVALLAVYARAIGRPHAP